MKPVTTAVLVTNIQYATIIRSGAEDGVRVQLAALVIYENAARFGDGVARKVRGFGPDPAWPVFDIWLGDAAGTLLEFTRSDFADQTAVMMSNDGSKTTPILQGVDISWPDGTVIRLSVEDSTRPIDFETLTDDEGVFPGLWPVLQRKVADYWSAPYMPVLSHHPVEAVRDALRATRAGT